MLFAAFQSPAQYLKEHEMPVGFCLDWVFSAVRLSRLFSLCLVHSHPTEPTPVQTSATTVPKKNAFPEDLREPQVQPKRRPLHCAASLLLL